MSGLRRPLLFSFVERYGVTAVQIATLAVMARLLTPAEIGVFMVGHAVLMLVETLRDFGATAYLIQAPTVSRRGVRTSFTVSFVLSAAFAAGVYSASGFVAAFYGQPGLRQVLQIAAMSFLVAPLGSPISALLRRDLAFGKIAVIGTASALVQFLAAVALASRGFGCLSLAWAAFVGATVNAALMMALHRWSVWMFRPCLAHWRDVLAFGGYSSLNGILNTLYLQLPQLLLGRLLTFDAVGLYSRATALCQMGDRVVLGAVTAVVLPAVARQVREGGDLKEPYLRAMACNSVLQWPFLICLLLLAEPIVRLLLGEQWSDVVPLVRLGAAAALFTFPAFMTYPILVGTGRIRDTLTLNLTSLPPSLGLLTLAAPFGVVAVAASALLIAPLQIAMALRFVRRSVPFSWREFAGAVRASAVVTLCAAVAPAVAAASAVGDPAGPSLTATLAAVVGAGIGWLIGLNVVDHSLLGFMPAELVAVRSAWRGRRATSRRSREDGVVPRAAGWPRPAMPAAWWRRRPPGFGPRSWAAAPLGWRHWR